MGDKGQKDNNKGLKQKAAKQADEKKKRREKQQKAPGSKLFGL